MRGFRPLTLEFWYLRALLFRGEFLARPSPASKNSFPEAGVLALSTSRDFAPVFRLLATVMLGIS